MEKEISDFKRFNQTKVTPLLSVNVHRVVLINAINYCFSVKFFDVDLYLYLLSILKSNENDGPILNYDPVECKVL